MLKGGATKLVRPLTEAPRCVSCKFIPPGGLAAGQQILSLASRRLQSPISRHQLIYARGLAGFSSRPAAKIMIMIINLIGVACAALAGSLLSKRRGPPPFGFAGRELGRYRFRAAIRRATRETRA